MREYEFRGKDIETGEWYYGCLLCTVENGCKFINVGMINKHNDYEDVDPNTVGQYTGIKDKNGKKIFEGDIVSFDDCSESTEACYGEGFINCGEVFYSAQSLSFFISNRQSVDMEDVLYGEIEVIGNIYDNPELLRR